MRALLLFWGVTSVACVATPSPSSGHFGVELFSSTTPAMAPPAPVVPAVGSVVAASNTPDPGGGVGSEPEGLPNPPGEPVSGDFYATVEPPYVPGTLWRRRVVADGNALIDVTRVVGVDGVVAHLEQWETRADGVTVVAPRQYDLPVTSNPLLAALPAAMGSSAIPLKVGLMGYEEVTVPAGSFSHCAKLGISGSDGDTVYTGTAWLAGGVGVVKLIATTLGPDAVTSTQELLEIQKP